MIFTMSLICSRLTRWENVNLLLFSFVQHLVYVNLLPLVTFQFQCIRQSGFDLCLFPEQYCHNTQFECRPCSKSVCDKFHAQRLKNASYTHQCSYNCSVGEYLCNPNSTRSEYIRYSSIGKCFLLLVLSKCLSFVNSFRASAYYLAC